MSTISTIIELSKSAKAGVSLRDRYLAFLLSGLGVMGNHRQYLKELFLKMITVFSQNNYIYLRYFLNQQIVTFSLRKGNQADYLMLGELVRGGYTLPDFYPNQIIDGGANIGVFAIQAKSYFPQAKIICYEPELSNFEQLNKNLLLNSIQATTCQLGLWSKDVTLYYHSQSSESGYVDENPPGIPIVCTLPKIESDCWLKLDIEGAEYKVLPALFDQGQYPRWLSMEIHYFDTQGQFLIDFLRKHKYHIEGAENFDVSCTVISAYRK